MLPNEAATSGPPSPLAQVSVRRSLVLMATGAVSGLLLAGYALFTARATSTLYVPAEDVALVNQQPISRSDFLSQLNTLYGVNLAHSSTVERNKVLDDMIREELFVQRAKELDLSATDPEVRAAMVNAVELEIAADAITEQPTEPALRAYFIAHPGRYASEGVMTVRDWSFSKGDAADAAEAVILLKNGISRGAAFERLHGEESTQSGDEQFYFAAKIHLGEQVFAVASHLSDGEVSAPVKTGDTLHVLYMVSNKMPVQFDFAKAHDQVLSDYRNAAISHLRSGDAVFLRKRANVQVADDLR